MTDVSINLSRDDASALAEAAGNEGYALRNCEVALRMLYRELVEGDGRERETALAILELTGDAILHHLRPGGPFDTLERLSPMLSSQAEKAVRCG